MVDIDSNWAGSTSEIDSSRMLIENTSAGTYYIKVSNSSEQIGVNPTGWEREKPSGRYKILVTYGPDSTDQPDDPAPYGSSSYVYVGPQGIEKTIYSTIDEEDPMDDVDWIQFEAYIPLVDYIIYAEPVNGMGADGVVVNFNVYPSHDIGNGDEPDTSSDPLTAGQQWIVDDSVKGIVYSVSSQQTLFVKITRDSFPENPKTGAYRFYVIVGADEEDNFLPDYEATVYAGEYENSTLLYTGGIDETPWIEKQCPTCSTDLSNRNELPDFVAGGYYAIPTVYRTLYRRDYDSRGESDGTTHIFSDVDFFWYQIPAGLDGLPIDLFMQNMVLNYSIPLKVSMWNITATNWNNWKTDTAPGVITETELDVADHVFRSYSSHSYKIEETNISGGPAGDYVVFKVEIDSAHIGATYQDINGYDQIYEDSGQYDIYIRRH